MFKKTIAKQFKKPSGFLGKLCAKIMDTGNLKTIDWVFSLMDVKEDEKILEIGYGSGILISKIAGLNKNNLIYGIDFSKIMYKRAVKKCKSLIDKSFVKLFNSDLINFKNDIQFDKIVAVNVVYFWDDLNTYLNYINTLLNSKGKLYLYFSDSKEMEKIKFATINVFNKYTKEEMISSLIEANFKNINVGMTGAGLFPGYCAIAEK